MSFQLKKNNGTIQHLRSLGSIERNQQSKLEKFKLIMMII